MTNDQLYRAVFAGDRDVAWGERAELELCRHQADLALERVAVADDLSAVGTHAAHDRGEDGIGDALGFVEGFAVADALEEIGVLLDVGVDLELFGEAPLVAAAVDDGAGFDLGAAGGALEIVG